MSVVAVSLLSAAYGANGAAMAAILAASFTVLASLILQSWARRSIEEVQPRPAMRFLETLRRRVVRNFNHLFGGLVGLAGTHPYRLPPY